MSRENGGEMNRRVFGTRGDDNWGGKMIGKQKRGERQIIIRKLKLMNVMNVPSSKQDRVRPSF